MKRPSFFFNGCGCSSTMGSSIPSAAAAPTAVCDDRYFTIQSTANVKLLGIAPGTNCQAILSSPMPGGLVIADGTGSGFIATNAPNVALPMAPSLTGSTPNTFQFLLVGTGGGNSTPWQWMQPPASGTWFVSATSAGFALYDAGSLPGLSTIFANAGNSAAPEPMCMVQTGTDGSGNPQFAVRKFIGSGTGDQPVVLRWNNTTSRYGIVALSTGDTLRQNGTISFAKLQGLDSGGANISGGFAVRPDSGITQSGVDFMEYDSATGIVYRGAPATNVQLSSDSSTAVTGGVMTQPAPHWLIGSQTIHHPTVEVGAQVILSNIERPIITLYVDGVETKRWDFSTGVNSAAAAGSFPVKYMLTALSLGSHTFDFRIQTLSNATILHSTAYLNTIR